MRPWTRRTREPISNAAAQARNTLRAMCQGTINRPRGVTVSTLDSESSDRGSNPREAFQACIHVGIPATLCEVWALSHGVLLASEVELLSPIPITYPTPSPPQGLSSTCPQSQDLTTAPGGRPAPRGKNATSTPLVRHQVQGSIMACQIPTRALSSVV